MLKRLGRVIWWFGAFMLLATVLFVGNAVRLSRQAEAISMLQAEQTDIQGKESALVKRYLPLVQENGAPPPNAWEALLAPERAMQKAPPAAQSEYAQLLGREQAVSEKLKASQDVSGKSEASTLLISVPAAAWLFTWAIAYVIGGRFWRPPTE